MTPPPPNNSFPFGRMLRLLLLVVSLAALRGFAEASPLRIVDSYQSPPGTLNVIFQNDSQEAMNVELRELGAKDEKLAVPFWWSKVFENPIAPGARTRMVISLTRPVAEAKEMKLGLLANEKQMALELKAQSREPLIQYAVQDAQSGKIYIYPVNNSEKDITVSSLTLNGNSLQGGNTAEPVELPSRRGGMIFGECAELHVPEGGYLSVLAEYRLGNEAYTEATFLFSNAQFTLGMEDTQNFSLECPTHKQGVWKGVGQKILDATTASKLPIPTVHFCRDRLAQGLPAFAQAAPRIKINPQASNINRGKLDALAGYEDVLEMARSYTRPGAAISVIENTSIFHGDFGALRNPEDEPLSERELLTVSLGALAHGAKGLEFRVEESDGEEYAQRVQYLLIRFELLRPFLSIGETIPLEVECASDKVNVQSMVCGDKGMLIFIQRKDFSDTTPLPTFPVSFAVPKGITLDTYAEVSAGSERGTLEKKADNTYALSVNKFVTASVYFCAAAQ